MSTPPDLGKVATRALARLRENPDTWFMPASKQEEAAARRLLSLGLVSRDSAPSEHFGLPVPVYWLTERGRTS
jgi:hypothetical protein